MDWLAERVGERPPIEAVRDQIRRLLVRRETGRRLPAILINGETGSGKGLVDHWVAVVKRGKIVFELGGVPEDFAKQILRLVAFKLSVKTRFVIRGSS